MWKNNFKIAIRSLKNNGFISFINVTGLGIGLVAGVFVLLYVQHELSYDRWINDHDQVYRVYRLWGDKGHPTIPSPAAAAAKNEIPEVRSTSRINANQDVLVKWNNQHFTIPLILNVDSTFFETIPLELAYGQANSVFSKLNNAVLSHEMSKRIFGKNNPVGEVLYIDNVRPIEISGVLAPFEGPTHLNADIFLFESTGTTSWTGASGYTYVRLHNNTATSVVESKLFDIALRETEKEYQANGETLNKSNLAKWHLQPLKDIHLKSGFIGQDGPRNGSYRQIGIMLILGIMVITLAIINYINLSTARLTKKASEIGIRKVIGASKKQLNFQFVIESFVFILCALFIAIAAVQIVLPFFNEIVSRKMDLLEILNSQGILALTSIVIILSIAAGIFPAFFFSRIDPVDTIKNQISKGRGSSLFRNSMVVFQFSLSIGMIIFVTLIGLQVRYMLNKELGFNGQQIAVFNFNERETIDVFRQKKNALLQIPGVSSITEISRSPGSSVPNYSYRMQGMDGRVSVNSLFVDTEWNKTFDIPIVEGRFLSLDHPTDTLKSFVVNEAFVKHFGLENPIGFSMRFPGNSPQGEIIGVIKDFHYQGLQYDIEPLVISTRLEKAWMSRVAINIEPEQIASTVAGIQKFWQTLEPEFPVNYHFIDQNFAEQYESYYRFGKSMLYTTIFCIVISLLGLFGLTTFVIQQRTKEIGIRKILGATLNSIVGLLSVNFLRLVLLAFAIASPIAWYFSKQWLQNFAYQVDMHWWVFAVVGLFALFIAFMTISIQTLKAALGNPVESLRNE